MRKIVNSVSKIPTTQQVLARQKRDAEANAVAIPDTRTAQQAYLDEVAPSGIVGRMIKWSKDSKFITTDDEQEVSADTDFIVLADQTMVGWMKFNEDAPPDRLMGAFYDKNFRMLPREDLGDIDQAEWPAGLSGAPEDPWRHTQYLVLQQSGTSELFTFTTSSVTGRRAVGNLLRHYDRMQANGGNSYPVVRLKKGGFNHRDDRIGWVSTPAFAVVGRAPKGDTIKPPDTSPAADLDDSIPY